MSRIVCGIFDRTVDADAALEALKREGFGRAEIDHFYLDPPGQHQLTPVGGDVHSDAGARGAGRGAMLGAAIGLGIGLALGLLMSTWQGATFIFLGAGLGALVGAIAGTMARLRGGRRSEATREHPVEPRGGRMIAVLVDRSGTDARAIDVLKAHRARDVRRAEGRWSDGSWRDFDPRAPLAAA